MVDTSGNAVRLRPRDDPNGKGLRFSVMALSFT